MSTQKKAGALICLLGIVLVCLAVRAAYALPRNYEANISVPMSTATIWYSAAGILLILVGWFLLIYNKKQKK